MYTDLVFFTSFFSLFFLCPSVVVLNPPHLNSRQLTAHPWPIFPLCRLSSATLLLLQPLFSTQPTLCLPCSLSLIWQPPKTHQTQTHLFGAPDCAIIFTSFFLSSIPSLSLSTLPPVPLFESSLPLVHSSFSSSLMPLLPPWYCGLPVDLAACGLRTCPDSTPLSSTPLRLFPLSLVPSPLLAPCPAAPPAVSKERYATLPLYSFRYVIILSSPFLLLLLPDKVGMSCLMLLALF